MIKMKNIFAFILLLACPVLSAQIFSGKITYERKINLHKKFKGESKEWIREEDKSKVDVFELYFNDTCSAFKPVESELKENFSWAVSKNTVYQNFNSGKKLLVKPFWRADIH